MRKFKVVHSNTELIGAKGYRQLVIFTPIFVLVTELVFRDEVRIVFKAVAVGACLNEFEDEAFGVTEGFVSGFLEGFSNDSASQVASNFALEVEVKDFLIAVVLVEPLVDRIPELTIKDMIVVTVEDEESTRMNAGEYCTFLVGIDDEVPEVTDARFGAKFSFRCLRFIGYNGFKITGVVGVRPLYLAEG